MFRWLILSLTASLWAQAPGVHCPRNAPRAPADQVLIAQAHALFKRPTARPAKRRETQPVNFIDEILFAAQAKAGLSAAGLTDDANFIRRVTLDLTGRLPELDRVLAFLKDVRGDKRERYIDEVLASQAFVERWAFWFDELFRNNYLSLYARGNWQLHNYLVDAIAANKPLDTLATELITAEGNSFTSGPVNYRVRASESVRLVQDRNDNTAAQWLATLMGMPARCISCHDGAGYLDQVNLFLTSKTRRDFWETAAFLTQKVVDFGRQGTESQFVGFTFSANPDPGYLAETGDGDRPPRRGGMVQPAYLLDGRAPDSGEPWDRALARMIVADRQFARNFANRLWAHMTGLGIVDPLDEFDLARLDPDNPPPEPWTVQPRQPALLEALADRLIALDFDLRAFLKTIAVSHTYQQRAKRYAALTKDEIDAYAVFLPRRLTAEEIADSATVASGIAYSLTRQTYLPEGDRQGLFRFINRRFTHQWPDVNYLTGLATAFGPGNRFDVSRNNAGSLDQALALMNSQALLSRLGAFPKPRLDDAPEMSLARIARGKALPRDKVRQTYLAILVREPSADELARAMDLIGDGSFEEAALDLHWILFNHVEYLFNY